jgi:hypothetical protein
MKSMVALIQDWFLGCGSPILPPTVVDAAVRCYLPASTTTLSAIVTETKPVLDGDACPLRHMLHHHHLPSVRHGVAFAVENNFG